MRSLLRWWKQNTPPDGWFGLSGGVWLVLAACAAFYLLCVWAGVDVF